MWKRKSDEQIASEEKEERACLWFSFHEPIILFVLGFLFLLVAGCLGPYYSPNVHGIHSQNRVVDIAA